MLVSAAVCPHPPVLVPDVAAGAADELRDVRTACAGALCRMLAASPDLIFVVGGARDSRSYAAGAAGSLAPYGFDIRTGGSGQPELPLSLTIGNWLLDYAGVSIPRRSFALRFDLDASRCRAIGEQLAARAPRVALLAMGDGSARRSTGAPGYLHPGAAGYDGVVSTALARGDFPSLLALDPDVSAELAIAGRAAWQALAGAAGTAPGTAHLLYDAAPYGVTYFVASWAASA